MSYAPFHAHGVKLWARYVKHSDTELEVTEITTDDSHTDIMPLVSRSVMQQAQAAIEQDVLDLAEYHLAD